MQRRQTVQRELVLNAVLALKCHATADEVYRLIRQDHPSVSKTTVYRNLNLLSETGVLRRIQVPGDADRFDHRTSEHYHVQCLLCGKVSDVDTDLFREWQERIRDPQGFVFLGCEVLFRGICPECNRRSGTDGNQTKNS